MKFLILPDVSTSTRAAIEVLPQRIRHHSGRAWISGEWSDDECVLAETNAAKIALFGTVGCSERELHQWLSTQGSEPDFAHIYRDIPGSYFTIVSSANGTGQAFGTLSSFRRLSYSTDPTCPVMSNSLRMLLDLFSPHLREDRIPLALIAPRAPWPLGEASYWAGIENVLPTDRILYDEFGILKTERRWRLPDTRVSLADAAPALQQALHDAIEARARHGRTSLSSDLSGGMDSTALAFFAREHVTEMTTMHLGISVEMNDDAEWATMAAAVLGSDHIVVQNTELPEWFAGWHATEPKFVAEPEPSIRTEGMHRAMAHKLHQHGSRIHLAGSGGDELFYPDEAILPGLRTESPKQLYRAVRAMSTVHRWPLRKTLRAAMDTSDPRSWLLSQIEQLDDPSFNRPAPAWDVPFSMSPWATRAASDGAKALLADSIGGDSLDAPSATDALAYGMITRNGQIHRTLDEQTREVGVKYEAPFLDDAVIELALQIRLQDRLNIDRFKPGLAAASRGVVPEHFLSRRSKGDYISLIYTAFNDHRRDIEAELPQFRLVERGYLDQKSFSNFLLSMQPKAEQFFPFEFLLASERWLRSADHASKVLER